VHNKKLEQQMKKIIKQSILGIIISIGALFAYSIFAQPTKEYTILDNQFIQTYSGREGIWLALDKSKDSVEKTLLATGSNYQEFLAINHIQNEKKIPVQIPLFFPYSEKKLAELDQDGKSREAVLSEPDKFVWPVIMNRNTKITSRIGRRWHKFHTGIDIACNRGSIIVAAADGEVLESGWQGHYGKVVIISHPQVAQTETVYAHNNFVLVKLGDRVKKGQIIAFSGTTGKSTGPHLHFEVRYQNIFLNPEHFLPEFPELTEAIAQLD
jgi:murein DD-endopeptidase MepM/ murein hydrolase activator NlpD